MKFSKDVIEKKVEAKHKFGLIDRAKMAIKFQVAGGMNLVMVKMFEFYKMGLDGYISGKPTAQHQWLMRNVVVPAINEKARQDDPETRAELKAGKERLLKIAENLKPSAEDVVWIDKEVVPYFDSQAKRMTGKALAVMGVPTPEEEEVFVSKIEKKMARGHTVDAQLTHDVLKEEMNAEKVR